MSREGQWCSFNFELWSGECREVSGCLAARRCHDWFVYGKVKRNKTNEKEGSQEGREENFKGEADAH